MKPVYILYIFLISSSYCFAQFIPEVKLKDNKTLQLSKLHIETNITGNIALTTYIMKFYNETNRVLEGELAFPLGDGQSVIDFAMDVNGEMRHAVIVEKELARVAYENTIRQRIDPGLLEKTKGNNYKARVYPIPAKGYKELLITYEETLIANDQKHKYTLPLQFTESISDFSIAIIVHDKEQVRVMNNNRYKPLKFSKKDKTRDISFSRKNFIPNEDIQLEMELEASESISTYNSYFNIYKSFTPKTRLKNKPKTIVLFWDASYSMEFRDLDREIKLLNNYFDYLRNVKVKLVVFNINTKNEETFNIKNGKWSALKKRLQNIVYDGGTSYRTLSNYKADEYLMFTDGMFNLGDFDFEDKNSVYTINAVTSANHNWMSQTATKTGANYINLKNKTVETAFNSLTNQTYQYLGIISNTDVYDVFPKKNYNVNEDFSLAGKFSKNTTLQMLFGYNNRPVDTLKIKINKGFNNAMVKRFWAKKKLIELSGNSEENKEEIIKLAKKNHLITSFTSMIILDRIEDYVRYRIEPTGELKTQYKALVQNDERREKERLEEIESRREDLYDDYKSLLAWYNTDFPLPKKKKIVSETTGNQAEQNSTQVVNSITQNTETSTQSNFNRGIENGIDTSKRIIRGRVVENGQPLPGANVFVLNKNNAVVTDFDGNYAINAEYGDKLVFSFVGFVTQEVTLGTDNDININLQQDASMLDEIVVVGFGTSRKESITGSVSQVKGEEILRAGTVTTVAESLTGIMPGVSVQQAAGQPGSSAKNIVIRGSSSFSNENKPLFIVDGEEKDFNTLDPDDIESISVIKDAAVSAVFGVKGANGVILVTTKRGEAQNSEKIKEFNESIDKAIKFKPWSAKSNYLIKLSKAETVQDAYKVYLDLRPSYRNTPTFFIDVAEYFESVNHKDLALQIVSNLIEVEIDNHELIRALGYKTEYLDSFELAVYVYEEVLRLRPEEPQSYRDLALAYEEIGEYQKAFDLFYKIIDGNLLEKDDEERYYGIEHLAYIEACNLVALHGSKLDLTKVQNDFFKEFKVDLRVVIDWNHNNTDLDLWVETPKSEKVSYQNTESDDGGRLSEDLTEGYGPEEFMIKKASKGEYEILVDYFNDQVQKISGPTALKVTIYTDFGTNKQKKEIRILRLDKEEDEIEVGLVKI
ncbi:MAG: VIT domain-containing protein [Jejuia sp.]